MKDTDTRRQKDIDAIDSFISNLRRVLENSTDPEEVAKNQSLIEEYLELRSLVQVDKYKNLEPRKVGMLLHIRKISDTKY